MNRNHFWKLVLIIGLVLWSISEIYPPTSRPLIEYFARRAREKDETFNAILQRAQAAQQQRPDSPYENLQQAIGTNDITRYFPFFEAKDELEPTISVLNELQREAAGKVRLGLDLQGGTSFVMRMDTNKLAEVEGTNATSSVSTSAALSQAVEVLRRRVDRFGVAEPVIQPQGDDRIVVQLPGLSESAMAEARTNLQKAAFLEFRLVYDARDSDELARSGAIVPGYEVLKYVKRLPGGQKDVTPYLVKKRPEMTGGIKSAGVIRGQLGQPKIHFTLDSAHSDQFARITEENVHRRLAIVLDGVLQTRPPEIQEPIRGGSGEISGDYKIEEAFALANVLENPLRAPLMLESSSEVDPTLGADSIRSGIKASIIGVIAVSVFMIVYYLLAGLVANVALLCNIVILLGVMCSIETTLTLPGIAGVVLTVGMAVDANVLIFERIREELGKGKSLRGALAAGYNRAFGTIFDSHVTTLISSIILIFMGTGSVKGFGVALTIGVAASLFTALVVTRLIFDWLIFKNIIKSMPMLHLIRNTRINFMRWAIPAFVLSWLIIIVGNSYGIFVRGSDVKGVEFAGGETITMSFNQAHKVDVDQLRKRSSEISKGEVLVAYQRNPSTGLETLRLTMRAREDAKGTTEALGTSVISELNKDFPQAEYKPLSIDRVGPTIGKEIQETAILASILAMFGILVYVAFRYEFTFAIGAVVAIIHDILMTLGCYFLAGRELNSTTVAAILTIIGFSINDTIVIFDRIREDLKLGVRGSFKELINQALNQTLSRTIITSGTVFLATLSLLLFGGGPINDFAFTFLVGIITGTYSSIYIASTLVYLLHKGQRPKIGSAQLTVETAAPASVAR
jgi:SecD/SecF fusion protein